MGLKTTDENGIKICEIIQSLPIEVTTSSWDVADEKEFFLTER